jgi:hypothetical protein
VRSGVIASRKQHDSEIALECRRGTDNRTQAILAGRNVDRKFPITHVVIHSSVR